VAAIGFAVLAAPGVDEPSSLTWTAAMLAWILAVPLYYVTKYVTVVAHEGGHALIGKLLFQKLKSVTFSPGAGGETSFDKKLPWLFSIPVALAGYLGPSMFGLLAAALLLRGETETVLWASLAFLFVMLFAVRGLLGWILVPGLMFLIYQIAAHVKPPVQLLLTHMWVWFLLIAPVERMFVFMQQQTYNSPKSDSAVLQRQTLLPSALWALALLVGTIAALVYGGGLLLHMHG
jgi:hypothetical protein